MDCKSCRGHLGDPLRFSQFKSEGKLTVKPSKRKNSLLKANNTNFRKRESVVGLIQVVSWKLLELSMVLALKRCVVFFVLATLTNQLERHFAGVNQAYIYGAFHRWLENLGFW
mgnify:CR=1 FL=1